MELIADKIAKKIHGKTILEDISLRLSGGNIYGFAGRNGSGKTMLFRALSGLMTVDSGTIMWEGKELHKDFSVIPNLGIVLENAGLYPDLTGMENLTYLANLTKKIGKEEIEKEFEKKAFNLEYEYKHKMHKLEKENTRLHKIIKTFEETVKKFIKWICNKFELPSEDEIVRNFEKETGNSLNAEKQFAKKERVKEFEKEL